MRSRPRPFALLLSISLLFSAVGHAELPTLREMGGRVARYAKAIGKPVSNMMIRHETAQLRAGMPGLSTVLKYEAADPHLGQVLEHSKTNGNYYVMSDLHLGVGRVRGGKFHQQEDFQRGDVFVRTMKQISHQPGNNTLVVGGDFLDILEHVDPKASLLQLKTAISKIVRGHAKELTAMARAVVNDGLHVVYLRGNHDIRMVDSSEIVDKKTTVRAHFISELVKAAGLTTEEVELFKRRVGFAGHMAALGKFGEMVVTHGEAIDPTNSWRSQVDPFSVRADGTRVIRDNFGDNVVRRVWNKVEMRDPDADNGEESATKKVAHDILHKPKLLGKAIGLIWHLTAKRPASSPALELADRINSREALRRWVEQSGFAEMMNASISAGDGKKLSPQQYTKILEKVYAELPTPLQERMTSEHRLANVIKLLSGARKVDAETEAGEVKFLGLLTKALPNVHYVVSGHDHQERIRTDDTGAARFLDSGTWTKVHNEWRMNVVVAHTDAAGRIKADGDRPELFRTNEHTGRPNVAHGEIAVPLDHVEGWSN